jgi:hypothetical protein
MRSWDSSLGTVSKLQADNPGFKSQQKYKFSLHQKWAHSTSYSVGTRGVLSLELKQQRLETDHSLPSSVFMVWTGTLPYIHSQILSPSSEPTLIKYW